MEKMEQKKMRFSKLQQRQNVWNFLKNEMLKKLKINLFQASIKKIKISRKGFPLIVDQKDQSFQVVRNKESQLQGR